ncbi:type II toxin-antitoxin system antitoxin SocA domain-containing protein [Mesoplasma florum]|uniref:type II toxin-antitoxin system antitoxin SocA domain-containing protein n=1 Tax=Mesoplasma florum TaxID=2151 RepID=UPI000D02B953|nr:type II toxin-antitoxin system antitoxin SocA domain-containing protein [Mesoplasma florum]AVN59062.1 hypothetical protein CG009_02410 [Mesoplasma florum]
MENKKLEFKLIKNYILKKYGSDLVFKKNNEGKIIIENKEINTIFFNMHKYLYFINLSYFLMNGEDLFDEEFRAYKNGSYLMALKQSGLYSNEQEFEKINESTKFIIEKTMDKLKSLSSAELMEMNHTEIAWTKAKNFDYSFQTTISLKEMKERIVQMPMYKRYLNSLELPVESSILNV